MNILEYDQLDTRGVNRQYLKVVEMIRRDDFYSADIKKMHNTPYYRAKLDDTNRLLFQIIHYKEVKHALMLDIIHHHAYNKSRFLRGAAVDKTKIIKQKTELEGDEVPYINPNNHRIHLLNKFISFDEIQNTVYQVPLPLMIIGSAGSGKTVITLEKAKQCIGHGLYITHSPYLAQSSRNLYYAKGYDNDDQDLEFFSYQEFLESIHVPQDKEIQFPHFKRWASKQKNQKIIKDSHQLYEEIRGVITGSPVDKPYLSQKEYMALGVKQSIYPKDTRDVIYDLFERYRHYLMEENYYDINLLSFLYLARCKPSYDFIVVDEVQDFTNIQLCLILKSLTDKNQFLLCGDSNQIVHPNFFSWSHIKTLFHQGKIGGNAKLVHHILYKNYRNSPEVTALANVLLKIKTARFGSIDKESHYLVKSSGYTKGSAQIIAHDDKQLAELNTKTKRSTQYAVIVMRDDMKERARHYFQTPLIFSIHEAKGLEYDNVILYHFISSEEQSFREICQGITLDNLHGDFQYTRVKDKTDRSLEIYKFYINSLYVAMTRAIKNIYLVESSVKHPLFQLLNIEATQGSLTVDSCDSSTEAWQREAHKLELQGKTEQAMAIREQLLEIKPVPWDVITAQKATVLSSAALQAHATKKLRLQAYEYALVYRRNEFIQQLIDLGFPPAKNIKKSLDILNQKHYLFYTSSNVQPVLRDVQRYGVDFRHVFNQTPLMIAARHGNLALLEKLIEQGANVSLIDNLGRHAFQIALSHALYNKSFAHSTFTACANKLAPESISIQVDQQLIKIDKKHMEYFMFILFVELHHTYGEHSYFLKHTGLSAPQLAKVSKILPSSFLPDTRKKSTYISSILSKNEASRDGPYNRKLFKRIARGRYILNPELAIKWGNTWVNAYVFYQIPQKYSQKECRDQMVE